MPAETAAAPLEAGARLARPSTLTDEVMGAVRDLIRSGELVPEQLYSVYQMADRLGVSRSPVREGLLRLAEAGLVTFERNRGFRVQVPEPRDLAEIFGVRLALEPAAAGRVAAGRDRTAVADLEVVLARLRAAAPGAENAFWALDQAFHEAVLTAAGNRVAARMVADLRERVRVIGAGTTRARRSLSEIAEEHAPVVAAIAAADPARAEAAMREHLVVTGQMLIAQTLAVPHDDAQVLAVWADVVG